MEDISFPEASRRCLLKENDKLWKREAESKISKNFQATKTSLHKLMHRSSELLKFDQPCF